MRQRPDRSDPAAASKASPGTAPKGPDNAARSTARAAAPKPDEAAKSTVPASAARRRGFARIRTAQWTGILFFALIIAPGLILGWMAIRASDQEEAVIEKQLSTTLLTEVVAVSDRITTLLSTLQAELESGAPNELVGADHRQPLRAWDEATPLVGVPFLFHRQSGTFLWPDASQAALPPRESEFLELNLDFFRDRRTVEVYQNLALEYADRLATSKTYRANDADGLSKAEARQEAIIAFEQDDDVKRKLQARAEESGKNVVTRAVPSAKSSAPGSGKRDPTLSSYVTESLRFSQIIGDQAHGWIPRLVDDRVMLLFWKRLPDDRILGCAVDEETLRERVLEVLPTALTEARILTVLDHTGRPIFRPEQAGTRDWRAPFVSREISEFLPRWEVAAYLADPGIISARAHTRSLTIGLLVSLLIVSILTGGLLVTRLLRSELRLAEQKTTFVANVSHELKTPLTSIRLFSEMLRDGKQRDPEKQRRYLDIMVSETERLTRLINNVLDFSRLHREKRSYSLRRVNLVALCRQLVETHGVRLAHAGFRVESAFEVEEAWARIDPEAVEQALLNLLSNAEKYAPDERWIRIALRVEGSTAVVSVADHGIGIRPRDAAHIFDEFFRADDSLTASVRGTGLGLTLSRQIIRDHGGEISFRPNEPKGSVFEMRLPLAEAPLPEEGAADARAAGEGA